jgi:hypothetical protein
MRITVKRLEAALREQAQHSVNSRGLCGYCWGFFGIEREWSQCGPYRSAAAIIDAFEKEEED